MTYAFSHFDRVAWLTLAHVELVAASLGIALAIALPLGVVAARNRRVSTPLLGVLSIIYTIPSLALLAVLVQWLGLGFVTALVALTAYAQYALVRNIATGLREVSAGALDAARGLGFTPLQSLLRVEFPLALPGIIAGVRIATISMIAIATLAAYVGANGLGTLIFEGLAFKQPGRTLAGAVCAMLLAIVADIILRTVERRAAQRAT